MHPDRYSASVVIACRGPSSGVVRDSPIGPRRSRDGALLTSVVADGQYWHSHLKNDRVNCHLLLTDPTKAEVLDGVIAATEVLESHRNDLGWSGGQIDLVFSGHGTEEGTLQLSDSLLSVEELAEIIVARAGGLRRLVGLVLDCCYSGLALAQLLTHPQHGRAFTVVDGFAASLHNEVAWELDSLSHGALTFTMKHPGNAHVESERLARAVDQGDDEYLRLALQAFVPNPVTYLTRGDQHSLDLVNGHYLTIKGHGSVEIGDTTTLSRLVAAMDRARVGRLNEVIEC